MIEERIQALKDEFNATVVWEDRYRLIIEFGNRAPKMDDSLKTEENRIHGCQSMLWLYHEIRDGRLYLYGYSDSMIVNGLVSMLVVLYSGSKTEKILETDASFLSEIGLWNKLSLQRANGLQLILRKIKEFANGGQNIEGPTEGEAKTQEGQRQEAQEEKA